MMKGKKSNKQWATGKEEIFNKQCSMLKVQGRESKKSCKKCKGNEQLLMICYELLKR
jgi:hypothetical protein